MIGAIIGDIVGSRFEFNNTNKTDFELFTSECSYTDDTICTVAIADAILYNKSYKDALVKWCKKYPRPMGAYGARFARWIHNPVPYDSFGNGSAMRVSPIGWAFESLEDTMREAALTAEVSHNHQEGVKGAVSVAGLIFQLRNGTKLKDIDFQDMYTFQKVDYIRATNSFNETCQITVPQAISCVMEANNFEEAIRLAVSIGGDTDTIAAIAGSIAEAIWGVPERIKQEALQYLPVEMIEIINEFTKRYGKV